MKAGCFYIGGRNAYVAVLRLNGDNFYKIRLAKPLKNRNIEKLFL